MSASLLAVLVASAFPSSSWIPSSCSTCCCRRLLWSAGLESSYVALRGNLRPIALLAVGLPRRTLNQR